MLKLTEVRPQYSDMGSAENVVDGFDVGKSFSEFIDEMNEYLNHTHWASTIYLFNKQRNDKWHQVIVEVPYGKDLDKSKLPKELLDLPICCDYCYTCFGCYSFHVYTYEDFDIRGRF